MTTEIGKLNTVIIKPTERPDSDIKVSTVDTDAFLSLTNRFGLGNGLSKVEKKDVISGAVADEINKIHSYYYNLLSKNLYILLVSYRNLLLLNYLK